MSHEAPGSFDADSPPDFTVCHGDDTRTAQVVYVAMKPQLRGRFRRNVVTLLELNAEVTVLTVSANSDFFVGLEHPRLRAEFLPARSLYVRLSEHTSRRSREHAERRRDRAAGRGEEVHSLRRILMAPIYLLGGILVGILRLLEPLGRPVRAAGRAVARAIGPAAAGAWRGLPERIRRAGWAVARWQVQLRRRARRAWLRRLRPRLVGALQGLQQPLAGAAAARKGRKRATRQTASRSRWGARRWAWYQRRLLLARTLRRQRRLLSRRLLQRRLNLSRATVRWAKDLLRPWHRTSRFLAFWRESAKRVTELAPALVVSSDLPGLVGAGRAARRLGVPHLHDCHELYLESASFRPVERRIFAPFERRYLRRAESVIAVNRSIAVEYCRRYGREPVVVRNCAPRLTSNLQVRDLRVMAGLPPSSRIVLYQGGFSAGRGLEVCVASVVQLPPDVHLVMLGYGPLAEGLVELAGSHGVTDRVHVLDAVPPEELASCTVSATVGLMPYQPVSRNNYLALPNKVFEYTAVGVPIVVSDLPELRRIALEEGCGHVFDPFDASSLAAALGRVLDPGQYQHYRDAARAFGGTNVWENEREILIEELRRISPRLRTHSLTSRSSSLVSSP